MKLTKILSFLLVGLMCLTLVSCAGKPADTATSSAASSTEPEATLKYELSINGVSIKEYKIVISASADKSAAASAQNLNEHLLQSVGIELPIIADTDTESDYEIIIGNTARAASKPATDAIESAKDNEYILCLDGNKVISNGKSYMVGGGIGELVGKIPLSSDKAVDITDIPADISHKAFEFKKAKSAILMLGSGMGDSIAKANNFIGLELPNIGSAITDSVSTEEDGIPTDDAAAATALSVGTKTVNGRLGMDKNFTPLLSLRRLADNYGANTGIVSTDIATGATPAGFFIQAPDCTDTANIQGLIDEELAKGKLDIWSVGVENLADETAKALSALSNNEKGFFAMLEEQGMQDALAKGDAASAAAKLSDFDAAVAYAIQFTLCHPDTVLVVTSDCETAATGSTKMAVPVYAIGADTEFFADKKIDNTEIPRFIALIFGRENFGVKIY